jgi:hypothetical protein
VCCPATAFAEDIDDLLLGRDAYINGEYTQAVERLRPLAELDVSTPRMTAIVTTARKFLAASLFSQQQTQQARTMLSRMLRDDPDARLDQTQFEPQFVRLFDTVLREMQSEIEQVRISRYVTREQTEARRVARERLLYEVLSTESVTQDVPRALMWIPFGVGQFANGQRGLGIFFLTAETVFSAACLTTFVVYQNLYPSAGVFYLDQYTTGETAKAVLVANWASAGLLFTFAVAGVVQANMVWEPVRVGRTVPRPIPAPLEGVHLAVWPTVNSSGAGAMLHLTF